MNRQPKLFYEFASFRIDTRERQLLRGNEPVSLTPKVFDLLLLLVENHGHTLGKDELMQKIWENTFVEENNLSRNISILRKTLGDNSRESHFIKTVPKRGYCFDSDVSEILEDEETLTIERRTNYNLAIRFRGEREKERKGERATGRQGDEEIFHSVAVSARLRVAVTVGFLLIIGTGFIWFWNQPQKNEAHSLALTNGTENAEAFELFRRGRELWKNRSAAGLHEATILLEQSVEKDPNFALAHAALADAYAFDVGKWKQTEEIANRAIQLNPNLGEPYASIGFVKLFWEWKPSEAERNFKKAVQLSPNYATARQWYAMKLLSTGQFNQALAEINRAFELEPDSIAINADLCQTLYFLERYAEAEVQCKKTISMDANSFNAHSMLYVIYLAKNNYPQAVESFFKREGLSVNHTTLPPDLEELKKAFERGGISLFWQTHIAALKRPKSDKYYTLAQNYAFLGDQDEAMRNLKLAYETRDFGFSLFLAEPVFRSCCLTDPRYTELRNLWENQ